MKKNAIEKLVETTGGQRVARGRALTPRQREIFEFVKLHIRKFGFAPTRKEIGDAFDLYDNGIQQHLMLIAKKGFIVMDLKSARAIRVVAPEPKP